MTLPSTKVALTDPRSTVYAQVLRRYEAERKIHDARLQQAVTLRFHRGDLRTLLEQVSRATQVDLRPDPAVASYKATAFIDALPVRDLMSSLVQLFPVEWHRKGREGRDGKYVYSLQPSLFKQLEEQRQHERDEDQRLLNALDEATSYLSDLKLSSDQSRLLLNQAEKQAVSARSKADRDHWLQLAQRYNKLIGPEFRDCVEAFLSLSAQQLMQLRQGESVTLSDDGSRLKIPSIVAERIRNRFISRTKIAGTPLKDIPDATLSLQIRFTLIHALPDQAQVKAEIISSAESKEGNKTGENDSIEIATGFSDRTASLRRKSSGSLLPSIKNSSLVFQPKSHNPPFGYATEIQVQRFASQYFLSLPPSSVPEEWVDSADLLDELHRRTGLNLLSDYSSRIYPVSLFQKDYPSTSRLTDKLAEELQSEGFTLNPPSSKPSNKAPRQHKNLLLFKRLQGGMDRNVEPPYDLLKRLQANRIRTGSLSLDDLAAIAALPPQVLDDPSITATIMAKWGLDEWLLANSAKAILGFYASLNPVQRLAMQSEKGLLLPSLAPTQIENGVHAFGIYLSGLPEGLADNGRVFIRLRQPGTYEWISKDKLITSFPVLPGVQETNLDEAIKRLKIILSQKANKYNNERIIRYMLAGPEQGIINQLLIKDTYYANEHDGIFDSQRWMGTLKPLDEKELSPP